MYLTERHIIKKSNPLFNELDNLCFLSKNLHNSTLYAIRQHYFETKQYLPYVKLAGQFSSQQNSDFTALPSKVSQQIMKTVDKSMVSFFGSVKKQIRGAKLPHYKDKVTGRHVVIYTDQAISKKWLVKGFINPSKTNVMIKTKQTDIQQVRIVPINSRKIVIEVVYRAETKPYTTTGKYAAIDLGVNNLMTIVTNTNDMKPIIINGKPLKSINQFYNKKVADLKGKLGKGQYSSKKLINLSNKRDNKIGDYLHKASRVLTNQLVSSGVSDLVIGYNVGWKQDVNLGVVNNQKFVQIPFLKLINMLKYKCEMVGIRVVIQEESYTSKCSFLDHEPIEKHDVYMGKRVKRGLFKTASGFLINADVNGALNILRKAVPNIVLDGVEVCSTPRMALELC